MLGFRISAAFDVKGLRTAKKKRIDNKYPIYVRIHKGIPVFVKLQLDNIEEKYWEGQKNSNKWVKPTFKDHRFYNEFIDRVIFSIREFIKDSFLQGMELSAADVKEWYEVKYLGKRKNIRVMVKTGDISIQDFFSHAIKDLTNTKEPNTIKVYRTAKNHLEGYSPKGKMSEINREFVRGFVTYLRVELNLKDNSLKKSIDKLRKVYEMYCSESSRGFDGLYFRDLGIRASGIAEEHVSLTREEYFRLLNLEIQEERLQAIRNIFIFLCNTGLYYNDLRLCKKANLIKLDGHDDKLVLAGNRKKTGKGFWIPLNKAAKSMLNQFCSHGSGFLLMEEYRVHDVTYNRFLKDLATLAGIKKNLTIKVARKTYSDWTKTIRLDQDYRNLMAGTLPKGVLDRNYTDLRNSHTYKEILSKLDG